VKRHVATRVIPLDEDSLHSLVDSEILPKLIHWLKTLAPTKPLGNHALSYVAVGSINEWVPRLDKLYKLRLHATTKTNSKAIAVKGNCEQKTGRIDIYLNGNLTPEFFLKYPHRLTPSRNTSSPDNLPASIYSILIHELTHAAEVDTGRPPLGGKDVDNLSDEEYINDPEEVRAFMQQVVHETVKFGKDHRDSFDDKDLMHSALMISHTWARIAKKLTPSNKKRIMKAVYTAFVEKGIFQHTEVGKDAAVKLLKVASLLLES
jgi:hypothetical protein